MVKRAAEKQITKDDTEAGIDGDDSNGGQAGFRKAAPEVLRQRRILKVRRIGAAGSQKPDAPPATAAGNPFASLAAAPPAGNPFAQLPPVKPSEPKDPASEEDSPNANANSTTPNLAPSAPTDSTAAPSAIPEPATNKSIPADSTPKKETKPEQPAAAESTPATTTTTNPKEKDDTNKTEKKNTDPEENKPAENEPQSAAKETETTVKTAEGIESSEVNDATKAPAVDSTADAKPNSTDDAAKPCDDSAKPISKDAAADKGSAEVAQQVSPKKPAPFVFGGIGAAKTTFADAASTKEIGFSFLPKATVSAAVPASANKPKTEYAEQTVDSGEDGEKTAHKIRSKVFELEGTEWRERGVGLLKLNVYDGGARLLLRTEATYRLTLNAPLYPSLKIERAGERGIRFKDLAGGSVFLCRVPTKDDVNILVEAIDAEIKKLPTEK